MRTLSTDRQILRCIYEMYESSYPGKDSGEVRGKNDPYLPIKVSDVASRLGCTAEMLFGRLYYHLDAKYRYKQESDAQVHLFSIAVGSERHCVNFPYLAAVLAEKDEEHRRQLWSLRLSIAALVLSVASIIAQMVTAK
ncbi:MAG: hypothetical protein DVS81_12455 [Candidatus Accumulibacter meliphilus]|jgi:hypothetical protein|uniref:Uncharacterized protein n=1 Tax=Candidatus Accumulibacter meliphilus TaxID=2211374 RepID=A0A369XJ64_9PROT|nr:MAG: hypothetical protein DVS81_12455 [Candidatus Accumulibacter meliphilus]